MEVISMKKFVLFSRFAVLTLALSALTIGPSLLADGGANHQVANTNYGVSGGNVNDITARFCCSGTLGSLVQAARLNTFLAITTCWRAGTRQRPERIYRNRAG